jgi:hypothetical protein
MRTSETLKENVTPDAEPVIGPISPPPTPARNAEMQNTSTRITLPFAP